MTSMQARQTAAYLDPKVAHQSTVPLSSNPLYEPKSAHAHTPNPLYEPKKLPERVPNPLYETSTVPAHSPNPLYETSNTSAHTANPLYEPGIQSQLTPNPLYESSQKQFVSMHLCKLDLQFIFSSCPDLAQESLSKSGEAFPTIPKCDMWSSNYLARQILFGSRCLR
jgi:hypothetical protein